MTLNITNAKPHPDGVQFDATVAGKPVSVLVSSVALADLEGKAEVKGTDALEAFDSHADRIAEIAERAIAQGYKTVNGMVLLDTQAFHGN
jgi:hypothetical protein